MVFPDAPSLPGRPRGRDGPSRPGPRRPYSSPRGPARKKNLGRSCVFDRGPARERSNRASNSACSPVSTPRGSPAALAGGRGASSLTGTWAPRGAGWLLRGDLTSRQTRACTRGFGWVVLSDCARHARCSPGPRRRAAVEPGWDAAAYSLRPAGAGRTALFALADLSRRSVPPRSGMAPRAPEWLPILHGRHRPARRSRCNRELL